jgi:hypothetical protein
MQNGKEENESKQMWIDMWMGRSKKQGKRFGRASRTAVCYLENTFENTL